MAAIVSGNTALHSGIREITGPNGLLTGADVLARSSDPFRQQPMLASAIARPSSTDELAQIVALCAQRGQRMVVHGGLTGVVGGACADENDIAISLERMARIEEINVNDQVAVVQAGVTVEALQNGVREKGLLPIRAIKKSQKHAIIQPDGAGGFPGQPDGATSR